LSATNLPRHDKSAAWWLDGSVTVNETAWGWHNVVCGLVGHVSRSIAQSRTRTQHVTWHLTQSL